MCCCLLLPGLFRLDATAVAVSALKASLLRELLAALPFPLDAQKQKHHLQNPFKNGSSLPLSAYQLSNDTTNSRLSDLT